MNIIINRTSGDRGAVTLPHGATLPGRIYERQDRKGEHFFQITVMFESGWSMGFDNYSQWQCLTVDWKDMDPDRDQPFFAALELFELGIPGHFAYERNQAEWHEVLTWLPAMIEWLKTHGTAPADRDAFYSIFPPFN